jgi:uncharacterized protein YdhG (YjbR/CyaY superfamily)
LVKDVISTVRRVSGIMLAGEPAAQSVPQTVDEYLASLSGDKRAALQKLRRAIRSVVPEAEECISYRLPAFRLNKRMLVWFGAAANHCAFYPGAYPIQACKDDLKTHDTSKGTVRFKADRPLPTALVRKLVRVRVAEQAARQRVGATGAKHRR